MAEGVFHVAQLAPQSGTMAAVGTSVPAITILPVAEVISPELDRGSAYPAEDYGRNVRNHAGRGHHGFRGATFSASGELTFEQAMHLFEQHYAGGIAPTGTDPYTWVYPLEAGSPTLLPYTWETGSETSQDQYELVGCLIDELTIGFDALAAPGDAPWTYEVSGIAANRVQAALTASLSSTAIESWQGQTTLLKEGTTATAFASLSELASSLIQFSLTTRRSLVWRPYGSSSDVPGKAGFSEKTSGEFSAMVAVGATSKSDIYDIYNVASSVLGERRWRISAVGSGTKVAHVDMRVGFLTIDRGDRDEEQTYEISGEIVDDTTLNAPAQVTVVNGIADLTP